jgi:hypothetical protein
MSKPEQTQEDRLKRVEKVLFAGKEDQFLLAWGRLMSHAAQSRWSVVFLGIALMGSIAGNVAFSLRWSHRDTLVFFKDANGNVLPLGAASKLTAGSNDRDEAEVCGFARRWVSDAFTYNPLNVKDQITLCLRSVDFTVQGVVKAQLRLEERAADRDAGVSVKLLDDPEKGRGPAASIVRQEPLEVSVVFQRIAVSSTGETKDLPPMLCNMRLRQIPRSIVNPSGLLISDLTVTKS